MIKRKGISFRPDDEVQEILDNITENSSIYIRKAIKFYHQYETGLIFSGVAYEFSRLKEEIRALSEKLDAIGAGSAVSAKAMETDLEQDSEASNRDELDFIQFAVNIGKQFMSFGQEASSGSSDNKLSTEDVEVADDEVEF